MPTINELADEFSRAFVLLHRQDGSPYFVLRDGSPEWMRDAAMKAHGDFMPDDTRYEFILDALHIIANGANLDEAEDSLEADIYNANLLRWVSSNLVRMGYVDEAMEEIGGEFDSLASALQLGQLAERREVLYAIWKELEAMADEGEEEEDAL